MKRAATSTASTSLAVAVHTLLARWPLEMVSGGKTLLRAHLFTTGGPGESRASMFMDPFGTLTRLERPKRDSTVREAASKSVPSMVKAISPERMTRPIAGIPEFFSSIRRRPNSSVRNEHPSTF
jgi:hypothetical protein